MTAIGEQARSGSTEEQQQAVERGFNAQRRARTLLAYLWRKYDAGGESMGRSHEAVLLETAMDLLGPADLNELQDAYGEQLDEARSFLSEQRSQRLGFPPSAGWPTVVAEATEIGEDAAVGLAIEQEPKYTTDGRHIVNRASKEPIPSDEPVFIFRARDIHAREALEAYACVLPQGEHRDIVCERVADFAKFAAREADRMKAPDTVRAGCASEGMRRQVAG